MKKHCASLADSTHLVLAQGSIDLMTDALYTAPPLLLSLTPVTLISAPLARLYNKVYTNGSITVDDEMGEIIQLQGDQRDNVREWLLGQDVVSKQEE